MYNLPKNRAPDKPALTSLNQNNYKTYKPDSVIPYGPGMAVIYLGCCSHITSFCQPADIGRAALNRPPIWHFSTQGLPLYIVTSIKRRLLPCIFTLTLCKAVIFCGTLCIPFYRNPTR